MILYFTGTGNSRYIAKKLAKEIGDSLFASMTGSGIRILAPLQLKIILYL